MEAFEQLKILMADSKEKQEWAIAEHDQSVFEESEKDIDAIRRVEQIIKTRNERIAKS